MLAGVAPGVVDADRRAADQFLGEGQVVVLVGVGLQGTVEADHAEGRAAGPQRHGDQGVDAGLQHRRQPLRVLRDPAVRLGQDRFDDGLPGLQ